LEAVNDAFTSSADTSSKHKRTHDGQGPRQPARKKASRQPPPKKQQQQQQQQQQRLVQSDQPLQRGTSHSRLREEVGAWSSLRYGLLLLVPGAVQHRCSSPAGWLSVFPSTQPSLCRQTQTTVTPCPAHSRTSQPWLLHSLLTSSNPTVPIRIRLKTAVYPCNCRS
jgi:hypothetical protein